MSMKRSRISVFTGPGALRRLRKDVRVLKRDAKDKEWKFTASTLNDVAVESTGTVQAQIFTIPSGDTDIDRDGRKIVITSINMIGQVTLDDTTDQSLTSELCRVVLFRDSQANGALPAVTDLFLTADITSFKNLDNTHRFRTLFDKVFHIQSPAGGGNTTTNQFGNNILQFKWFKKVRIPILYTGTAGTIGDIASNNLVLLYISERGVCGCKVAVQVRYLDN